MKECPGKPSLQTFLPHCPHALRICGLFLHILHVAWSVLFHREILSERILTRGTIDLQSIIIMTHECYHTLVRNILKY